MTPEATAAMLAAVEEVAAAQRDCLDSLRQMNGDVDRAESTLDRISVSLADTSASLCRIQKMQAEIKEILIAPTSTNNLADGPACGRSHRSRSSFPP